MTAGRTKQKQAGNRIRAVSGGLIHRCTNRKINAPLTGEVRKKREGWLLVGAHTISITTYFAVVLRQHTVCLKRSAGWTALSRTRMGRN